MVANQPEVNSKDQYLWRQERVDISNRLKKISVDSSLAFVSNFKNINLIPKDRILATCLFDLMPSIDQCSNFDKICRESGKKIWLVTDNIIDPDFQKFENISIWSYPELLGTTASYGFDIELRENPSKLYNCFMQRCDSTRQSWFYFLWLENLLDSGYVSYLLYQLSDFSNLTGQDLFDFIHYRDGLDSVEKFRLAYFALKSKVPYRNFSENFNLSAYISDSKYSLILETYALADDRMQWCVTEKLLRSLQFGTINLIFAQKYTVKKLKELGLAVDPINDHFDGLDWILRQRKILEILVSDEIVLDNKIKYNQCMHNRSLLNRWKKTYQRFDFFDNLKESIHLS